jgi:hypothetical protein
LENVFFPEIILIFALHKNVTGGSYKYQTQVEGAPHFVQHNIEQVNLKFGAFNTSMNAPDFGTVGDVNAERLVVRNYKQLGIFGMKVNPTIVTPQSAAFETLTFPMWRFTWFRQTDWKSAAPNKDCSASHGRIHPFGQTQRACSKPQV